MMSKPESYSFGKSLIVPSVQELSKQKIATLPTRYVRSGDHDLPDNGVDHIPPIPVIDLHSLLTSDENLELQKLHLACQEWGFFQIVNHGIPTALTDKLRAQVTELFKLPIEEKKKLWQQPDNQEGFGQLFVVSEEQKLDWSDMFFLTTLPKSYRNTELLHKLPTNLRETLEEYSAETKKLAVALLGQLCKALKMDNRETEELFSDGTQTMRMCYYPPCPQPDKAVGFTPHSDADAITILFQLDDTDGLEINKDGMTWVPVKSVDNALLVNIGDIMEILSNGVYLSIEHRVTVNTDNERLSVVTFYSSNLGLELGPARSLVGPDNPPIFRSMPLDKYFKEFYARELNGKSYLDFMRLENTAQIM